MSMQAKKLLTPEEYLALERAAEFRSEYHNGEMLAMAGGTEAHTMLVDNLISQLHLRLRGGPCRAYSNNMRVKIGAAGSYLYPHVVIACGERQFLDDRRDTLLNPIVIMEVPSECAEAYDRGKKFGYYRSLESLQEYVVVSADRVQVESYRRQPEGAAHRLQ